MANPTKPGTGPVKNRTLDEVIADLTFQRETYGRGDLPVRVVEPHNADTRPVVLVVGHGDPDLGIVAPQVWLYVR